jgi:hypothetical protein
MSPVSFPVVPAVSKCTININKIIYRVILIGMLP